ncbi:unnamed protein product [Closterium sp. Naga37s-1]|nr:unnamed protein product [Closterium sp. Naga37s-1]
MPPPAPLAGASAPPSARACTSALRPSCARWYPRSHARPFPTGRRSTRALDSSAQLAHHRCAPLRAFVGRERGSAGHGAGRSLAAGGRSAVWGRPSGKCGGRVGELVRCEARGGDAVSRGGGGRGGGGGGGTGSGGYRSLEELANSVEACFFEVRCPWTLQPPLPAFVRPLPHPLHNVSCLPLPYSPFPGTPLPTRPPRVWCEQVCVSNSGRPAAMALHDLAAAAADAFLAGHSLQRLLLQLQYGGAEEEEFRMSEAGYRLTSSEQHYRTQWIKTVYLTMYRLHLQQPGASFIHMPSSQQSHGTPSRSSSSSSSGGSIGMDVSRAAPGLVLEGQRTGEEQSLVHFDRALATAGASGGVAAERRVIAPQWLPISQLVLLTCKVANERRGPL